MSTAVFTIVSKNYFHFARTLMSSVESHHPEIHRFVLLADDVTPEFFYNPKAFELVTVKEVDLPHFNQFMFRYNILELNTAVKPYMFDWIFKKGEYDKVIYMDPDICLYDRMDEVISGLDNGNLMVLTPHVTEFLEDGLFPGEVELLKMGTFNLGFLGVAKHPDTFKFIDWWKRKLEYQCLDDISNGLFVDQKWMDLVSGYFDDLKILKHVGYNIAYWNAVHRRVAKQGNKYFVNGQPLIFFHYSGIVLSRRDILSKHTNRFNLEDLGPAVKELYYDYVDRVLSNDHEKYKSMPYAYGKFEDGTVITNEMRRMYLTNQDIIASCGQNPFVHPKVFLTAKTNKGIKQTLKRIIPGPIKKIIKALLK